jgi:hypothetical protein
VRLEVAMLRTEPQLADGDRSLNPFVSLACLINSATIDSEPYYALLRERGWTLNAFWICGSFGSLIFLEPCGMLRLTSMDPLVCVVVVDEPRSFQSAMFLFVNDDARQRRQARVMSMTGATNFAEGRETTVRPAR